MAADWVTPDLLAAGPVESGEVAPGPVAAGSVAGTPVVARPAWVPTGQGELAAAV